MTDPNETDSEREPERTTERTTGRRLPPPTDRLGAVAREHVWLLPALVVGAAVYATYLLTHPYPAFGAGLFLSMAEQISRHGYALPATIPHYTAGGIPFAYPPLAFYVVAALSDLLGVEPFAFSRVLPGLFSVLYLIPFYLFGTELLGSKRQAGLAALIVTASPPVLQWHLSAGGFVRALAVLFAFSGLYTGIWLFRTGERRWLVGSTALFGLTVLTHPLYTAFFGLSYLWLYAYFDRSLRGLVRGAVVAAGGALLAAPWWLQVIATHGADVFAGAAGTHGGIGTHVEGLLGGPGAFDPTALLSLVPVSVFDVGSTGTAIVSALFLLFALTAVVLGWEGRFFLPVWFVALAVLLGKPRLPFVAGALMVGATVGIAVDRLGARTAPSVGDREARSASSSRKPSASGDGEGLRPPDNRKASLSGDRETPQASQAAGADGSGDVYQTASDEPTGTEGSGDDAVGTDGSGVDRERRATLAAFGAVGLGGLALGVTYAGRGVRTYGGVTPSLPPFIDDADVRAMAWIDEHLPASATFVVVGDTAEWFPYYTDRTILVGPWGVEWRGHDQYRRQLRMFRRLSRCERARCFTARLNRFGVRPDYLYVPKGEFTVRSFTEETPPALRRSLIDSPRYRLVHENEGAMVFRVGDLSGGR